MPINKLQRLRSSWLALAWLIASCAVPTGQPRATAATQGPQAGATPTSEAESPIPATTTHTPAEETRAHAPTATLDPASLTPSAASLRLAEAVRRLASELGCQGDDPSAAVRVDSTSASVSCLLRVEGGDRYGLHLQLRLNSYPMGLTCFHGHLASTLTEDYPVSEVDGSGNLLTSFHRKSRYLQWHADGVEFSLTEWLEGSEQASLPPSEIQEVVYQRLVELGLISGEGTACP